MVYFAMFSVILLWILVCKTLAVFSIPEVNLNLNGVADRFQNAVQQQTFQSILVAIEERLQNLDNIYSMQLSETLKSKMDLYHRKLDSLDTKIIRLESMVMLNLDKISENISTKNYKDDITRTQTYKKLENIYDGLSHRVNYIDRKIELGFEKIQGKVDSTLQRLERMEEDMIQRNADIESELSETLSILESYKSTTSNTELLLLNITNTLKVPKKPMVEAINLSIYELMHRFNESVATRFDSLENNDLKTLNKSEETNEVLNSIIIEIKEDFNNYANKVADMNVDIWKRSDMAEENLKTIETVINSTRTELQNGLRALMLQIGKTSGKGIMNNDKTSLESLKKSVNLSLEKIITNQDLFLESCHRVQMDESQIESEISVMLGKLIDMLETKMTTVMKDMKGIEKAVKNHDSRIHRNVNQANTNIISLFEKTTRANDFSEKELQDIKFYINSLFTFVQDVLPKTRGTNSTEDLLNDISLKISNLDQLINNTKMNTDKKLNQLESHFLEHDGTNDFIGQIKNATDMFLNGGFKHHINITDNIDKSLVDIRKMIRDVQKSLQNANISDISKPRDYEPNNISEINIDIRADFNDISETTTTENNRHSIEVIKQYKSKLASETEDYDSVPEDQYEAQEESDELQSTTEPITQASTKIPVMNSSNELAIQI